MANTVKEAPEAAQGATEAKTKKKSYKLRADNKFLTVGSLGVQFIKGVYTTTDAEIAKALLTIDGVELDED